MRALLYLQCDDLRLKSRALKYLRCEELAPRDRELLGHMVPRNQDGDALTVIAHLGQLMAALQGMALVGLEMLPNSRRPVTPKPFCRYLNFVSICSATNVLPASFQ
jgi:hypothetical protein